MKTEVSAGGVIVRRHSSLPAQAGGWQVLLIRDMNGSWTFPKGLIEKGEKKEDTATREITEEVALSNLRLLCPLKKIEYSYRKNGLIQKTVHYFLFKSKGKQSPIPQKGEGISDVQWFSFTKASTIIGYQQTNLTLLREASRILKTLDSRVRGNDNRRV